MKRFWNLMYYYTFLLATKVSYQLIVKPIFYIIGLFSPKVKSDRYPREYKKVMHSKEGIMSGQAYAAMFFTGVVILSMLTFYASILFDISLEDKLIFVIIAICAISYLINYLLLLRNGTYIIYFKNFESSNNVVSHLYLGVLFHLLPLLIYLLSLYLWYR